MKELVFNNGHKAQFTDESTVLNCETVVKSFKEVDAIRAEFTEENLKGAKFDGETIESVKPVYVTASADINENIVVKFVNREKTDAEKLNERLEDVEAALMEMN
jgi:alpha-L-arabinofuranosidase